MYPVPTKISNLEVAETREMVFRIAHNLDMSENLYFTKAWLPQDLF